MIERYPEGIFERPWRCVTTYTLTAAQNVLNNTVSKVQVANEISDPFNLYDGANFRINMPPWARSFEAKAYAQFTAGLGVNFFSEIRDYASGGGSYNSFFSPAGNVITMPAFTPIYPVTTAGRYLEFYVYQNSGSTRALFTDGRVYLSVTFYP